MITPTGVDHLATKVATESASPKPSGAAAPAEGDQLRLQEAMQRQGEQDAGAEQQQANAGTQAPKVAQGAERSSLPQDAGGEQGAKIDAAQRSGSAPERQTVGAPDQAPERPTMGDAILKGMDHMRSEFQNLKSEAASMSAPQDMSPADLLKIQMQTSRVMVQEQLVGQVAGKADQDVETLLKTQ